MIKNFTVPDVFFDLKNNTEKLKYRSKNKFVTESRNTDIAIGGLLNYIELTQKKYSKY